MHVHLTNYVQEGTDIHALLDMMGRRVGRVALFGTPLQQTWCYANSGDSAPTHYLDTDAPLYYYSFTDAFVASAYQYLPKEQRARFDPLICGFNPADMYAVDHIRRVLRTYPGVFSGIGELTIHKESVSSKIAGEIPSLTDPALDRVLDFAAESGLVVLVHSDVDRPFARPATQPTSLEGMKQLARRHAATTIVWTHVGLGRAVFPVKDYVEIVEAMLADPSLSNLHFDLSRVDLARYLLATPETTRAAADLINRFPDRFIFGSDVVAPVDAQALMETYDDYAPLWWLLTSDASHKVKRGNYERLFDAARTKVRAWEKAHAR